MNKQLGTPVTIIEYIPYFLDYCANSKQRTPNTIQNYRNFLSKFIFWLEQSRNLHLIPKNFSNDHVSQYTRFLSTQTNPSSKQVLSLATQNYYLIALRALLSYFIEANIKSLSPTKINLLKDNSSKKPVVHLSVSHLARLLSLPDCETIIGLRDKCMLLLISFIGLKVSQIASLTVNDVEVDDKTNAVSLNVSTNKDIGTSIYLPYDIGLLMLRYLSNRNNDGLEALFINARSPMSKKRTLTPRSIERIIKKYGYLSGMSNLLTPESLRMASIRNVVTKIARVRCAGDWSDIESKIIKTQEWLTEKLLSMPEKFTNNPYLLLACEDCIRRKIAILLVSGKVVATEINLKGENKLWDYRITVPKVSTHGGEWHRTTMDVISNHFSVNGNKVSIEPALNWGRADLGIAIANQSKALIVEVGTVSLFKMLYNLYSMKGVTFLVVPSNEYALEFKVRP